MATNFTDVELEEQARTDATKARTVTITFGVSESALRLVRAGFNPDRITAVGNLHLICAGIITALENIRDRDRPLVDLMDERSTDIPMSKLHQAIDDAARDASIAISHIETGCMYAVKAATSEVYTSKVR